LLTGANCHEAATKLERLDVAKLSSACCEDYFAPMLMFEVLVFV